MKNKFKNIKGQPIEDLALYMDQQFKKNPDIELHIGTDSQNGNGTVFCTVIAFRFPQRGAHCIFSYERVPRIKDRWQRLYHEAELSIDIANWISEFTPYNVDFIDLDYNTDTKHFSNTVLAAGAGLVTAMGYKSTSKPQTQVAARAADNYC